MIKLIVRSLQLQVFISQYKIHSHQKLLLEENYKIMLTPQDTLYLSVMLCE